MQFEARTKGHDWKLLPEPDGLALLPRPSEGDVFYDIEGDPFYEAARGLEYLHGVIADGEFRAFWAKSREEEQRAFEQLVDFLTERLLRYPDMHVYHYAHYEVGVLRRLAGEYGTREEHVDELLRREVFVDLYRVVAQSLRISHPRYGLKQVETFFMPERTEDVSAGDDSILVFEQWLDTGDDALLESIERYNEFDCRATEKLREWLLERRAEAGIETWKEREAPREITEEKAEAIAERERLRQSLLEGAEEGDERWLLGQLLEYHRREARPVWWNYFRRLEASEEELRDWDSESIAGLELEGEPEVGKTSTVFTLRYPPQQHKLSAGGGVVDPATEKGETIVDLDEERGRCGSRAATSAPASRCRARSSPAGRGTRASSARRSRGSRPTASATRTCARSCAATCRGRGSTPAPDEAAASLDDSYLFIQGPPGSGKTYTGAQIVARLLRDGQRVGVAAPSHKAIHNLLAEIEKTAAPVRALKKCGDDPESRYDGTLDREREGQRRLRRRGGPAARRNRMALLARAARRQARLPRDRRGRAGLARRRARDGHVRAERDPARRPAPARAGLAGRAPAAGRAARCSSTCSATTPPCRRSAGSSSSERAGCTRTCAASSRRSSTTAGCCRWKGSSGSRSTEWGRGCATCRSSTRERSQSSPEEAEAIAREIESLVGRTYTAADGRTWPLRHEDVLVVAPYNQQVRTLRGALPAGVRVGTVDKFQGQEAPVVFYSTTSSSGEEVPRGLEFLFSRNRLNVAISRAQCLAVLVGSPRLLDVRTRSVDQMRLVNALCRFVEMSVADITSLQLE